MNTRNLILTSAADLPVPQASIETGETVNIISKAEIAAYLADREPVEAAAEKGLAADIRIDGVSTSALRDTAKALKAGAVGRYSADGFVHVDVGSVRYW